MYEYATKAQPTREESKDDSISRHALQVDKKANYTGIPDYTKARFESMSGLSMVDVRVHYNSDRPAQLKALAYTQGNQVYIGPGQEKHLEHELGHVVQQKTGMVRPTAYINSNAVNDDPALEAEADRFADSQDINAAKTYEETVLQRRSDTGVIQRRIAAMPPSANWRVISEGGRPGFLETAKRVFTVKKDENLCHIIPYNTISSFLMATIENHMNGTIGGTADKDLSTLIKMVIPSAGYRFKDDAGAGAAISDQKTKAFGYKDEIVAGIPIARANPAKSYEVDSPASSLENLLNSSISNLRPADAETNQSIGNRIDPISGSYKIGAKTLLFDGTARGANQDTQSMAKRMHKLIKLGDRIGFTAFVPRTNRAGNKIQTSESGGSVIDYHDDLTTVNVNHEKKDGTKVTHIKGVYPDTGAMR